MSGRSGFGRFQELRLRTLQWSAALRRSLQSASASSDGEILASTNRIFLKNQTTASENGIYLVIYQLSES